MKIIENYLIYRDWEKEDDFVERVLQVREDLFAGRNFEAKFCFGLTDEEKKQYLGKLYSLLGFTSCGWFWGGNVS